MNLIRKGTSLIRMILPKAVMFFFAVAPFVLRAQDDTGGTPPPGGDTGGTPPPGDVGGITNPLNAGSLSELLEKVVKIAGQIGFYVAVFFIIYSGFKFVQARGNPKEIQDAKTMFLWAVIGTAVLLGAWIFARAIQGTINAL